VAKTRRRGGRRGGAAAPAEAPGEDAVGGAGPDVSAAVLALAITAALFVVGLFVYAPALDGAFVSDDGHYVAQNPYIHDLTLSNLVAIWNPTSVVAIVVENYAPVHLLLHAFEWQIFGESVRGYHVVNVAVHALASALLVLCFLRGGLPQAVALLGGLFFFVHPGNVEAVAWISQLKTTSAMVLCLGAWLLHPRRPRLALALFALALLAKPTAAVAVFALAVHGAMLELRSRRGAPTGAPGWQWRFVAGWAVVLALFAVAELTAFGQTAGQAPAIYPDLAVRLRSVCAIALRYAVMGATGLGLSTFHETPPAASWLDPWWLGSLVLLASLAWRTVATLRAGDVEAVYWVWAAVSFAPICGVIPLPFPMADRYLYFLLPGLLGGVLHLAVGSWRRLQERRDEPLPDALPLVAGVAVLVACLGFAFRAHDRAAVWRTPATMMADAERNYPDGAVAKTRQASRAARAGDIDAAIEALNAARARGYNRLDHLLVDPAYAPFMQHPRFSALLREMAREWIDRLEQVEAPSQLELRVIAQAYIVLDERTRALEHLREARQVGGPVDAEVAREIEDLERSLRIRPER